MSLKKDESKKQKSVRISPYRCTQIKLFSILQYRQGTSFYTCRKGSLTVEAAVVIPLMMGFFITVLFFFHILFIQEAVEEALIYTGRTLAVESVLTDSEEAMYISAEGLLKYKLLQNETMNRYVTGGALGVSLLGSNMSGKEIHLIANYLVKFPISFWGQRGLWLTSRNSFVKWKGDLYAENTDEGWVYITETGSVYHKDTSCRSLDLHIREGVYENISDYRGSSGQRYYACTRCIDEVDELVIVYYTDYGRLYHMKLTCSALKRTILRVKLSDVMDKRPCSFCYE